MKLPRLLLALNVSLLAGLSAVLSGAEPSAPPAPVVPKFDGATPLEWSRKLADSEMKRIGNGF
jgi:hypothetical protein